MPASATSAFTASMQALRLRLSASKSPWYASSIFGGSSPCPIRCATSAVKANGRWKASIVSFIPSMIGRNSGERSAGSPRTPSSPAATASRSRPASPTSARTVRPIRRERKTARTSSTPPPAIRATSEPTIAAPLAARAERCPAAAFTCTSAASAASVSVRSGALASESCQVDISTEFTRRSAWVRPSSSIAWRLLVSSMDRTTFSRHCSYFAFASALRGSAS